MKVYQEAHIKKCGYVAAPSKTSALSLGTLFVSPVLSQTFRGRVQGVVTDETKAAVVGASVGLLNINTGVKVARQTGDAGAYLFDNVDPGTYSVSVEMPGFAKF